MNLKYFDQRICLQCGKSFFVRKCYTKRGQGKFCSTSCGTTFRNLTNNPSKNPSVKLKISQNHADVSGENNPMYGRKGKLAPGYIDGRNSFTGETYRKIALANGLPRYCAICKSDDINFLEVHHIDGNHDNNNVNNLVFLCSKCHQTIAHISIRDEYGRFVTSILNNNINYKKYA